MVLVCKALIFMTWLNYLFYLLQQVKLIYTNVMFYLILCDILTKYFLLLLYGEVDNNFMYYILS